MHGKGEGLKGQCADREEAKIDEDVEVGKDQIIKKLIIHINFGHNSISHGKLLKSFNPWYDMTRFKFEKNHLWKQWEKIRGKPDR